MNIENELNKNNKYRN